ncbi:NAD(P)-dependent oxidoreductase [Ornithinicoccus halotolerans]|uniref:NAD(P)-dependent oxidoreductase n=1 Tax=Ornithinicoccus halotolerans TaxID=1748220 RepID=UPI001295AF7B|nr:NAD(P)-dependent oxidoreductase [Ornithinicoccus halotolerans]
MSSHHPAAPDRRPVVLVTSRSFGTGGANLVACLEQGGYQVVRAGSDHDLAGLAPALGRAVGWVAGTGPVTAHHLAAAPALRAIARYGVGVDAVDLAAAESAGVTVTNTPGANTEAVAEHALALLLAVLRRVPDGDARLRAGDWTVRRGRQLGGSTVGVVGFGRIGRASARLLAGLGCTVLVHDPYVLEEQVTAAGYTPVPLARLRTRAGAVSLHCPGGEVLVDERWVAEAPAGQVIVNTARASLVDEAAVAAGLRSGRLHGYAADTLATETAGAGADGVSPLLDPALRDRVVLTPHLGAQTEEAIDRMGRAAVEDLLAVLAGREPAHPVVQPRPRPSEVPA